MGPTVKILLVTFPIDNRAKLGAIPNRKSHMEPHVNSIFIAYPWVVGSIVFQMRFLWIRFSRSASFFGGGCGSHRQGHRRHGRHHHKLLHSLSMHLHFSLLFMETIEWKPADNFVDCVTLATRLTFQAHHTCLWWNAGRIRRDITEKRMWHNTKNNEEKGQIKSYKVAVFWNQEVKHELL